MSKAEELAQYLVNLPVGSWEEDAKNKEAAEHLREQDRLLRQALQTLTLLDTAFDLQSFPDIYVQVTRAIVAIKEASK